MAGLIEPRGHEGSAEVVRFPKRGDDGRGTALEQLTARFRRVRRAPGQLEARCLARAKEHERSVLERQVLHVGERQPLTGAVRDARTRDILRVEAAMRREVHDVNIPDGRRQGFA